MYKCKPLLRFLLGVLSICFSFVMSSYEDAQNPCALMKAGRFKILDNADSTAYVVMSPTSQTEFYNNSRNWIRSSVKWTSDCVCELTVVGFRYPEAELKNGDKINMKVVAVDSNIISFEAEMNGEYQRGRYLKMGYVPPRPQPTVKN
jgi:hypothetical protein